MFPFNLLAALITRLDNGHAAIKMYGPDGRLATWAEYLRKDEYLHHYINIAYIRATKPLQTSYRLKSKLAAIA